MLVLVTNSRERRSPLVSRLTERGIYTFVCPYETAKFWCDKKDTGGVLLDTIGSLNYAERLGAFLRRQYPEMPIGMILSPMATPGFTLNRLIRENGDIFEDVLDFCIRNCGWRTAKLSTSALTLEDDPAKTLYMGYPMPLTPHEHALLRFLLYRAPFVTSTNDLLSLCFSNADLLSANLSTHIHNINRRALMLDPRPLIVNGYGQGYRLRGGIA